MPNHITNRLEVIGDENDIAKVLDSLKSVDSDGDSLLIDFNNVIPRPSELDIVSDRWVSSLKHNRYNQGTDLLSHLDKLREHYQKNPTQSESDVQNFLAGVSNYIKFGYATWYEWSIDNWGTKWNAYYQSKESDDAIRFDTAWAAPIPVILELSKRFPEVTLILVYADECTSSNTGKITFEAGKIVDEFKPEYGSVEAYDIYFYLNPEDRENYYFEDGKYIYIEEE